MKARSADEIHDQDRVFPIMNQQCTGSDIGLRKRLPHRNPINTSDIDLTFPNVAPTGMSHPAPVRNPRLPPAFSILRVSDLTLSGSPENRTPVGSMLPMIDILSLIDSTALRMSTSVSQENATHPVSAILSSLSFVFPHMWTTKSFPTS